MRLLGLDPGRDMGPESYRGWPGGRIRHRPADPAGTDPGRRIRHEAPTPADGSCSVRLGPYSSLSSLYRVNIRPAFFEAMLP